MIGNSPLAECVRIRSFNFLNAELSDYPCATIPRYPVAEPLSECRALSSHHKKERKTMKYMITWNERPQGSPIEYEKTQKRILDVFSPWKAPANFKIESFVIRVGDWGGYC